MHFSETILGAEPLDRNSALTFATASAILLFETSYHSLELVTSRCSILGS